MGYFGRDPEFFQYVEGDVANRILKRAEYALTVLSTHNNPYLEYILTGNFRNSLPFYLRESNFEAIRKNLDKLILFRGDIMQALEANRDSTFDGFNLSDIFEYMSYNDYTDNLKWILKASKSRARLVYWNMLADRKPSEEFGDRLEGLDDLAEKLFVTDKAFFYKALRIEQVR
jgi:S-adenosylmethionine-diacylglycerol 3-amino-3-carboxypropyl transferase